MEYRDLDVWKFSRKLVNSIYELTKSFPSEELYGLTNQIRRWAVSIPSNIAEGCGRRTSKDTIQFLYISRGSSDELETQLVLAFDQEFIIETQLNEIIIQIESSKKPSNGCN